MTTIQDQFTTVDGMRIRYLEQGKGLPVLFLHGASLGSSADVFIGNLKQFADAGFRAIAPDMPGFGLSDNLAAPSFGAERDFIPKFLDALGLKRAALVAHSRSGAFAVPLALKDPDRYSHVIVLGTGGLLPLQNEGQVGRYEAVQARVDREMAEKEPTLEDARKLLQADTYNHALIGEDMVAVRHARSIGKNFQAHVARQQGGGGRAAEGKHISDRLVELKMPLLMIYGREDRAHAAERAALLKEKYPQIDIYVVDHCKHMVHWDAAAELLRLAVPFLKLPAKAPV